MFVIMWAETYATMKADIARLEEKVRGLDEQIIMVQDRLTDSEKRADHAAIRADNAVDRLLVKKGDTDPITPVEQPTQAEPDPFEEVPEEVNRIIDAMRTHSPGAFSEGGANV